MGTSLWMAETAQRELSCAPLREDLEADVCVVGAGFTGLTAALELARAGRQVCVVDAHAVGAGVSGHTTAKVAALHGTVYEELRRKFGGRGAAAYAAANCAGVDHVADTARELAIDCALRRRPAVTYVRDPQQRDTIEQEADAAVEAGLPARLTTDVDLPYEVAAAVELPDQLEIQPRAYLLGVAREVLRLGGRIFEGTMAVQVGDGARPHVRTAGGQRIRARDVIVASHYPFPDRGLFFMRLTPMRSYAIAVRAGAWTARQMTISADQPTRSVRAHPGGDGGELLIVGGEGHKAGEDGDSAAERFGVLERFARDELGAGEVTHRWSAHDLRTADGVPYVGPLTPVSRHVLVGTGYRKWGLSNGTYAGRALADRILGRQDP
ncbi:MAG TPA: FAD-binding oxidoreductase, partial [Baekduia sp.]|nr:FAD-binding oxidoreductase [Baekduia sp.]